MFLKKCKHIWKVLAKTICKDPARIGSMKSCSEDLALTLFYGKITLILTCEKCGEVKKEECYGEIEE